MTISHRDDRPSAATTEPADGGAIAKGRPFPRSRGIVFVVCTIVAVLLVAAAMVSFGPGIEFLGLVLALEAIALGAFAIFTARADARVSNVPPTLATVGAAVLTLVIGVNMAAAGRGVVQPHAPGESAVPASATISTDEWGEVVEVPRPEPKG